MKKAITLVLALAFSATVLSGCSGNRQASVGNGVTLKYIMAGPGKQEDSVRVWEAFNEKLQQKIPGVSVEFSIIPLSEMKQQFLLMQTTKQTMDIANTYSLDFAAECRNGTFVEIDELLEQHGKDVSAILPKWLFDYMKVDGKLYGIPTYQQLTTPYTVLVQKEYADAYLNVDALRETFYSSDILTEAVFDVMEDYLKKMKDAGKIYKGYNHWSNIEKGYETIIGNYVIRTNDPQHKVMYVAQTPSSKLRYSKYADWYKKGYIRQDSLSSNDEKQWLNKSNGYVMWTDFDVPDIVHNAKQSYDIDIVSVPVNKEYFIPNTNAAAGTAITTSSKYPNEAMKVLNLIQSDKELYNLLVFGIEGTHYTKIAENRIETPYSGGNVTSNNKYGLYKWIVGNTELAYADQSISDENIRWAFDVVNVSNKRSGLIGFVPDTTAIASMLANVNAAKSEYMATLTSGSLGDDWENYYNEWISKIDAAGNQKIIEELQKQVDAFFANKK